MHCYHTMISHVQTISSTSVYNERKFVIKMKDLKAAGFKNREEKISSI